MNAAAPTLPAAPHGQRAGRLWLPVFLAGAALYVATACRSVQWQDSGWQQYRIVSGQIEHPRGLALYHPVHYYLGRAALAGLPWLEPAHAITLVSALAAAAAVANVAALLLLLTGAVAPALVGAGALALSHTFWQHATHTESYTITAALLTSEWLLLARWMAGGSPRCLVAALGANGLGIGNHLLAALATPVDAVVVIAALRSKRISARWAAAASLAWLLGTLPYSAWVAHSAWATGDLPGTLRSALFAKYAVNVLNTQISLRQLALTAGYVAYNFPGIVVPLAIWGMVRRAALPRTLWWVLACELAIFIVFVARYSITDQYSFLFPVYALLAVFGGLGVAALLRRPAPWRRVGLAAAALSVAWTPLVYATTASVLRSRDALPGLVGNKPYRDGYRAFFLPWGAGESYGQRLNDELARLAGNDGTVIIADHMQGFAIRYGQLTGAIPAAVTLLDAFGALSEQDLARLAARAAEAHGAGRRVVLVPRDRDTPGALLPGAAWERAGDLYLWPPARP